MLIPLRLSAQTDEQLMQRAARGSNQAFEELYNRHARRLQGFFARRLGDDSDLAADFMHDSFMRHARTTMQVATSVPGSTPSPTTFARTTTATSSLSLAITALSTVYLPTTILRWNLMKQSSTRLFARY